MEDKKERNEKKAKKKGNTMKERTKERKREERERIKNQRKKESKKVRRKRIGLGRVEKHLLWRERPGRNRVEDGNGGRQYEEEIRKKKHRAAGKAEGASTGDFGTGA